MSDAWAGSTLAPEFRAQIDHQHWHRPEARARPCPGPEDDRLHAIEERLAPSRSCSGLTVRPWSERLESSSPI